MKSFFSLLSILLLLSTPAFCQSKGSLFIIGGGNKSKELMQALIATAQLAPKDYIAVLPMVNTVKNETPEIP